MPYVAIIDAGSTKSELFIYKYTEVPAFNENLPEAARTRPETIERIPCGSGCKTAGPIHKETNMNTHMSGLLNAGLDKLCVAPFNVDCVNVPQTIPVYVMATAGVRGRGNADAIMVSAWDAINTFRTAGGRNVVYNIGPGTTANHKKYYSFVIPPLEEGVYAWVTMNNDKSLDDKRFGITELGGASMQVAYEDPAAAGGASRQVCLFSSKYRVASQSWGFGAEVSRLALDDILITRATRIPQARRIPNPCMPEGEKHKIKLSRPPHTERETIGTGRFSKCLHLAESLLNAKLGSSSLPKLHNQIFADRIYAMANYWYTYEFFAQMNQYRKSHSYGPLRFEEAVRLYCNFKSHWKPREEDPFLPNRCFDAAWLITLFHGDKGFHLGRSAMTRGLVHFPSTKPLNFRASWTRGAAIMFARHGSPKTFCSAGEFPEILSEHAYNETATLSMPSSPIQGQPTVSPSLLSNLPVLNTAQPVLSPNLLPSLPAHNAGSAFSVGLSCGFLMLALVMIVYRYFSTHRLAVQPVPVSDEKLDDDRPVMVHVRRSLLGAIFLPGEDNISNA